MLKFLFTLVALYVLLVAFVYLMQGRMLYLSDMPGRSLDGTPNDVGLEYEDVLLETTDGVAIHGWLVHGETSRVLLFFHGNAGNISHRLASIRQLVDLGLSIFIIDYRGYGQSEGKPSEDGLHHDAEAAWQYLTGSRGIRAGDIVIFGRSLGGAVAAWLAARERPGALILDSSFTSAPDIGQEVYPWLPVRLLSKFRHATLEHLVKASTPLLVVHSRDDEIIPFHHGEALFDAAKQPKTFLELRGGHNDAHFTSETIYIDGLRRFLESVQ